MKHWLIIVVLVGSLVAITGVAAQEVAPVAETNLSLLDRFLGSSLETVLYRLPVGDYEVSITGERFPDKAYFLLDIAVPPEVARESLAVSLTFTPNTGFEGEESDAAPNISASLPEAVTLPALQRDQLFVVNPIPSDESQSWIVTITITDAQTTTSADFYTFIWPRSPELPNTLAVLGLVFPALLAIGILVVFRTAKLPIMQSSHPLKNAQTGITVQS